MTYRGKITYKHIIVTEECVNIEAENIKEAYEKLFNGDYFVMFSDDIKDDIDQNSVVKEIVGCD